MKRAMTFALIATLAAAASACTLSSGASSAAGRGHSSPELAARYNTQLAYGYMREGHMDIAQQKLALALRQAPHLASVHNALAFYYERIGNPADADRQYRLSLRYQPDDPNTLNNYGAFLCRSGKYRESLDYFDRAASDLNYGTPDAALSNAGMCALKIPDAKLADRYFRRALAIAPDSPQPLWQLGLLSFQQGDYATAQAYLAHLIETRPDVPAEVLWTAVKTSRAMGNRADAQRYGEQLLARFPDSQEAREYGELIGGGP